MSLVAHADALLRLPGRRCALAILLGIAMKTGYAQDLFEVHVLEYETVAPGAFTLETHMAAAPGSRGDGVRPEGQGFHITEELTGGVTDYFSMGVMELNAVARPGALEYAGWRLVPHFYLPANWRLPFRAGMVTEFSFEKSRWSAASPSAELIPVLEADAGRIQIDVNPSFAKPLSGTAGTRWEFGFAARAAWHNRSRFTPSLEYFSSPGYLTGFEPLSHQVHEVFPGGDIRLTRRLMVNAGVGLGLTSASDPVTVKVRVEFDFGRRTKP